LQIHRPSTGAGFTEEELEFSKRSVAKCGGLPNLIVAVAEYFNKISISKSRLEQMKHFKDHFMYILENDVKGFQSLRGLISWMKSCLTCNDSLKPCIFYLPVFTEDNYIRRRRL
jgi:hypothetical protein